MDDAPECPVCHTELRPHPEHAASLRLNAVEARELAALLVREADAADRLDGVAAVLDEGTVTRG